MTQEELATINLVLNDKEIKPIAKLQELRQQYPEIKNVRISSTNINQIINKIRLSSNFGQNCEGVLFGRESENEIIVSSFIPCSISECPTSSIISYLDTNRLDTTKVGFYFCDEGSEVLSQNKLKLFIEFQKLFPNCVILAIDINAIKVNTYPFKCFRISSKIMDKVEEEEIEENIYLNKDTIKDFYKRIFQKMKPTKNMIEPLNLTVTNDIKNIFEEFAEKYLLDNADDEKNYFHFSKDVCFNLNRKLKELNKNCENIIEEQKKYITYYKNKKANEGNKDENKKRDKSNTAYVNNNVLNEDKFDFFDYGILSHNCQELNSSIKDIINKKEIDSFSTLKLI